MCRAWCRSNSTPSSKTPQHSHAPCPPPPSTHVSTYLCCCCQQQGCALQQSCVGHPVAAQQAGAEGQRILHIRGGLQPGQTQHACVLRAGWAEADVVQDTNADMRPHKLPVADKALQTTKLQIHTLDVMLHSIYVACTPAAPCISTKFPAGFPFASSLLPHKHRHPPPFTSASLQS
jgi:hypothetical protein